MIHRALRTIRRYHETPRAELSSKLGIPQAQLTAIESGKKPVQRELLEKYSDIYDIKVSSLIFFSETLSTHPKKNKLSESFRTAFAGKVLDIMEWVIKKDADQNEQPIEDKH
ncbi:helix-turn-helix domain-containing protein [Cobetia marina]|uniref:helix-turn-helix domain-containing protein n=1 Tax=Cobetia marina TaxID=28258 RepID=UPI00174BF39B